MSKNIKTQYDILYNKGIELEAEIEENQNSQHELIADRLVKLKQIGKSVYRKLTGNGDMTREERDELLKNLSWIFYSFDSIDFHRNEVTIKASTVAKRSKTFTVPFNVLQMSDRQFASLIRHRISSSRKLQKYTLQQRSEEAVRKAKLALAKAEKEAALLKSS